MSLPRFSENLVLNNVALTLCVCGAALVALLIAVSLSQYFIRRSTRGATRPSVLALGTRLEALVRSLAVWCSVALVLICCGGLAASVYSGTDLHRFVDDTARSMTQDTVLRAAETLGILLLLILGSAWLRRAIRPVLPQIEARLLATGAFKDEVSAVKGLVAQLEPLLNLMVLQIAVGLAVDWLALPATLAWAVRTLVYVFLVLRVTRTLIFAVQLGTEALDRIGRERLTVSQYRPYYDGVRGLWPLARRTFEAITWIGAATVLVAEFDTLEGFAPFGPRFIRLISIYFVARVAVELVRVIVVEALSRRIDPRDEVAKRRATLVHLIQSLAKYVLYFGAFVLILGELGLDPAPFLAGAGIIGLTVGLGAQKLVNDMVSGFFMLFEGQLLTGDYVRIGEVEGIIEAVHLRVTEIRDNDGRLHMLRNGNIEHIVNFSREYVHAVVDVGVAYDTNFDLAWSAIKEAGERLRAELPDALMSDTVIAGVEEFGETSVNIRTLTQVHPGTHLAVTRAMRRHLLQTFADRGVEIPFLHVVLIHKNSPEASAAPVPPAT